MKPEAQRIAIAEARGKFDDSPERFNDYPDVESYFRCRQAAIDALPDYLNDRNAIDEAIGALSGQQVQKFCDELFIVTGAGKKSLRIYQMRVMLMATTAQLAEAYLKTIGKWRDDA